LAAFSQWGGIGRVGRGLVTDIVRMKMIFQCEARHESAGMIRIAQNGIEVDHTVKSAAGSDPFVDLLPSGFLFFRVVTRNVDAVRGVRVEPISLTPRAWAR